MTKPTVSGVTVSFTKDELDWLSWVLTEVLGKATHVPTHDTVKSKVDDALSLIREINNTMVTGTESAHASVAE